MLKTDYTYTEDEWVYKSIRVFSSNKGELVIETRHFRIIIDQDLAIHFVINRESKKILRRICNHNNESQELEIKMEKLELLLFPFSSAELLGEFSYLDRIREIPNAKYYKCLVKNSSMPACKQRSRSLSKALAVSAIIKGRFVK